MASALDSISALDYRILSTHYLWQVDKGAHLKVRIARRLPLLTVDVQVALHRRRAEILQERPREVINAGEGVP